MKENGRRFKRNSEQSDSKRFPEGNQINVYDYRLGKILSVEDSMIREVHYNAQDAQTWLLDSSATFHVTPNIQWFSNYSVGTIGTI